VRVRDGDVRFYLTGRGVGERVDSAAGGAKGVELADLGVPHPCRATHERGPYGGHAVHAVWRMARFG